MKIKFKYKFFLCLLIIIYIFVLVNDSQKNKFTSANTTHISKTKQYSETLLIKRKLHNGDAKFYNGNIITSIHGNLTILSLKGKILKTFKNIKSNWIDSIEEENIIVASAANKTTTIIHLDDKLNVISKRQIFSSDNEEIDPTLRKINGMYYMTLTDIVGKINNDDITSDNGKYSISLYQSSDSKNWNYVTTIMSENANLEDGILYYKDKIMYFIYEKELCDKMNSSIHVIMSKDYGKTWVNDTILLDAIADNEVAYFTKIKNGFRLYYSNDINNSGASYDGAEIFVAEYNDKFIRQNVKKPKINNPIGNLLFDVRETKDGIYLLFTQKYLTDSNLILEKYLTKK